MISLYISPIPAEIIAKAGDAQYISMIDRLTECILADSIGRGIETIDCIYDSVLVIRMECFKSRI